MDRITDHRKVCQYPWHELSALVQEAVRLGFNIESRQVNEPHGEVRAGKRPLPGGHRFFDDALREAEARVLSWLISKHKENCWFMTLTFKDYTQPDKAKRLLDTFLARLSQSYRDIPGAALLKSAEKSTAKQVDSPAQSVPHVLRHCTLRSVATTEWQQRDVIHYHLLIYGDKLESLSRKRWEFRWRVLSGGFAANYEAELKAAPYLVKHQIKDRPGGNLHLGGAWRGINPPRSLGVAADASNGIRDVVTARASVVTALVNSCQA